MNSVPLVEPERPTGLRQLRSLPDSSSPPPAPSHQDLGQDLRQLREKGLLRIRGLQLPALQAVARLLEPDAAGSAARDIERLLRRVCDRFGDDDFGLAARYLFGLVQGTIGHRPTDLRERAAALFGLSPETFRKDRERQIVDRLADELLLMVEEEAATDTAATATATRTPTLLEGGPASSTPAAQAAQPRSFFRPPTEGLPGHTGLFTGRSAESAFLVEALTAGTVTDPPLVCAVHGMAGVGKTALAVQVARQLATHFEDGILFVDLHGHAAQRPCEEAGEVLGRLLLRLHLPTDQIPAHADDRSALLSELLADRQVLLILDDAKDLAQVLPLLPTARGCAVIITSRVRLGGLDEARHLALGVLPRAESVQLFTRVAAIGEHTPDQSTMLDRLAERCGDLPLAVRIAAARHRMDPGEGLDGLLLRLLDERARLDELNDGNRSVAAALAVSFEALPGTLQHAFLILAQHPGPFLTIMNAAALLNQAEHQARRALDGLLDRHLLERSTLRRNIFHDLVAEFARHRAAAQLPAADRTAAFHRLADTYLGLAATADLALTPHRHRIDLELRYPCRTAPALDTYQHAVGWVSVEEANLVAVCLAAGRRGFDVICWQLAHTLRGYFFISKRWGAWRSTHEAALHAARRLGDRRAEGMTLNNLGLAALEQDLPQVAAGHYDAARTLFQNTGDAHGEHTALANLAWVAYAEGRYEKFLTDLQVAYDFYTAQGSRRNAAITLRGMALGEVALGHPSRAIQQLHQSLATFRELGLPLDVTIALNNLGEAEAAAGDGAAAERSHRQALQAAQECHSVFEAARAWAGLGAVMAPVDLDAAHRYWAEARSGYQRLQAPQANRLPQPPDQEA